MSDLSPHEIEIILFCAKKLKDDWKSGKKNFSRLALEKSLVMFFEKPSLRTHLSFSIAMTQMGGHGVFYDLKESPLGTKESYEDTAKVISR